MLTPMSYHMHWTFWELQYVTILDIRSSLCVDAAEHFIDVHGVL